MNDITDKNLRNMAVPTVNTKAHQEQLKQALRAASRPTPQTTKKRWSNLMTKKKFMLTGVATTFAALAIVAFSLATMLSPVSAEELTQRSLDKVSRLSPSELQDLDMKVNGDPKAELQAAKDAKDLKILTPEEFNKLSAQDTLHSTQAAPGDTPYVSEDGSITKYLRYTSSDGAVHTIGLDKDGLPILIMVFRTNSDGSAEGSVQVQASGSGHMVSGSANTGSMPAGMVACTNGPDGVKCTNSDGSPAPAPNCQTTTSGGMTCSASASAQIKP